MRIGDWMSDVCSYDLQVGAGETVFAGETVDQYFGGRHAIGEIIERITAAGGAVEMDVRRGIEARGPERHAGEIGLVHEVGERQRLSNRKSTRLNSSH